MLGRVSGLVSSPYGHEDFRWGGGLSCSPLLTSVLGSIGEAAKYGLEQSGMFITIDCYLLPFVEQPL